jgi:hypothetical protein
MTGLKRYLDTDSDLLDARKSAIAVRGLLDEALQRLESGPMASESATRVS